METPLKTSSCWVQDHFRARSAPQAVWFLPLEMGLDMLKGWRDAYNKFWLVLSGNPKLGIHRETEASCSSCAKSGDGYCCSTVGVAAVPWCRAQAALGVA